MKNVLRFLEDESGFAAAEFGAVGAILTICTIGVVDIGNLVRTSMRAKYAVAAGAGYAFRNGFDASAISAAVTAASNVASISVSPSPSQFYGCATSSGVTTVNDGSTACSGTTVMPGVYVRVQASAPFRPIFKASMFSYPDAVSATAVVRIK